MNYLTSAPPVLLKSRQNIGMSERGGDGGISLQAKNQRNLQLRY